MNSIDRSTRIENARVLTPAGWSTAGVTFDSHIRATGDSSVASAEKIDGIGRRLTPGLVDLHTHGIGHFAFERSADDLRHGLQLVPAFGVTTLLPTLYRSLRPENFGLIGELAAVLDEPGHVHTPGFHFEGPFLAIAGAGAYTLPGDVKLLDDLIDAAGGRVAAMSISPEVSDILKVIERLCERGVTPFITHTRASVTQTQAAIDAGARHATHFYDVFPVPAETDAGVRPVGAVETILADPRVTVDFICDGVHVHPMAVRMALACKGDAGVVAITDSNIGAGLPPGIHDSRWGYHVRVAEGEAARVADRDHPNYGTLAGSALTMNRAVANLCKWFPDAELAAWRAASRNAARVIGLSDRGEIASGQCSDLVLWDVDDLPAAVWVAGACVYRREPAKGL